MRKRNKRVVDLSSQEGHQRDHSVWSRRQFLHTLGLVGATSLQLNALPITGMFGFPLATALDEHLEKRKLVLIRLKGGNDGLNTIVPKFNYGLYKSFRPTIAHPENSLINLDEKFAIPNAMSDLMSLWENEQFRVVNSVGYADHNLSHFTGSDIMASGNNDLNMNGDGWLARYYGTINPDYMENPGEVPPAIKIGGPTSILFNNEDSIDISANYTTAEKLAQFVENGVIFNNTIAPDDCYYGDQVLFVRTIANAASRYSNAILEAYNDGSNAIEYTTGLGESLQHVARLIKGDLSTQLYLVTLDGFDTHVAQNGGANHPGLLNNLSTAIKEFYDDLNTDGRDEEVLCMTYSEFGRRVNENGVSGTDHGTALPIMLFGPALNGSGVHGKDPDLDDLNQDGNLKFGTDFRSVYATLLERWFCIDAQEVDDVMGAHYDRLDELGLVCSETTSTQPTNQKQWDHRIIPQGKNQYKIEYQFKPGDDVELHLYTIDGKHVQSFTNLGSGIEHGTFQFSLPHQVKPGQFVYVIKSDQSMYSGQFFGGTD